MEIHYIDYLSIIIRLSGANNPFLMLINHYKKLLIKLHNTLEERKLWKGEYARVIGTAELLKVKTVNHL
jgi:hypothetical protein